ncbi:GntR family transcriptional regulator [Martelella radicis]|uniref:DNA-binding GntR family transcriptional regulator n=1 Tax=Martelella radicis TaxID=1397476 RepID=A0A7W6PCS3_9HYPH|nr:GntR family transcriptional regulator [Martelella radicis]MBB4124014.1 DNA-binding GntR family transcriptional regulator [Martelella radicis]
MTINPLHSVLTGTQEDLLRPAGLAPAAARVYQGIRARIILLELEPHSNLVRGEIADSFGLSQSPIREAINRLEQEGLVLSYPQSRTVVSRIDVDHARETQFLRVALELEVVRALTLSGQPELLGPARRILALQKMAGEDRDINEFTSLDRLFHFSLAEAAGVVSLYQHLVTRSGHIDRLRRLNLPDPGKMASVIRHHEAILAAIGTGNLEEAQGVLREHLSGTLAAVAQIREQFPQYF